MVSAVVLHCNQDHIKYLKTKIMKFVFKSFQLFVILFSVVSASNASTITWLGGNAAWDDPTQWDTGSVPASGDDVIIPSGYVKIFSGDNEKAISVEVQSSARLYIYNGGELEISGAVNNDALHNMGRVYIVGSLAINSITQTNTATSAHAIKNENRIYTYSSCYIKIKYIDDVAISNEAYSYFRHRGSMWIYQSAQAAIINADRFFNSGSIDINDCGDPTNFIMVNTDDFRNYSTGEINLDSDIYGGISNEVTTAYFRNYGEINISNVNIAINNHGSLTNYADAVIEGEYNNSTTIYNRNTGNISNNGYIKCNYSASGIFNYGNLYNHKSFTVFYGPGNGAIRNFSTGTINNYDYIYLNSSSWKDLQNDGEITNHYGGHFALNNSIDISSSGVLYNYGFLISYEDNTHIITGILANKGVVDDNYGNLQSLIDNDRVIVAPVSGQMQVGVPYPNVLDVHSLDDVNIVDWKVSQNGAVAGTYDETTNEFTPNASAIGVSTIYIEIYDLVSGDGRNFTLELDSPIVSLQNEKESESRNEISSAIHVNIYPNPTQGSVQLTSKLFEESDAQLQIYNSLGQLVQEQKNSAHSKVQSLEFSSDLIGGIYFIKILQEGRELDIQKVQLNR